MENRVREIEGLKSRSGLILGEFQCPRRLLASRERLMYSSALNAFEIRETVEESARLVGAATGMFYLNLSGNCLRIPL